MKRFLHAAALLIVVVLAGSARADSGASDFIQRLTSKAVPELTDQSISVQERRNRFRHIMDDGFDMKAITRYVVGRYWRQASPPQQQELLSLARDYVVQLYADRFKDYSGVKVNISGERKEEGWTIVQTVIDQPAGKPQVRLDWRVEASGGKPAVTDMIIEGVSMVTTQRSEFASVIRQNGVDGLINLLKQRTGKA